MRNLLNSVTGGALLSLFTLNAQSQDLKPDKITNLDEAKELYSKKSSGTAHTNAALPLLAKNKQFKIPNFKHMYNAINQEKRSLQFDGKKKILNDKSGSIRFDRRTITERFKIAGSAFISDFNNADLAKYSKAITAKKKEVPQKYDGALYFKKGFVHEINAAQGMEHGGGTLSATPNTSFQSSEDGQTYAQADLEKMVKMAIETDGFEIALDFNTDENGEGIIYSPTYLDADNGKIRAILTKELDGTDIAFENRNANDVLADYRGYIVEKLIENIAVSYFQKILDEAEADIAVQTFMEEKFNKNADKVSNGAANASVFKNDQGERAVNIAFQAIPEHRQHIANHQHGEHSDENHSANTQNHTHIGYVKVFAQKGGVYNAVLGPKSDNGTNIIIENAQARLDLLNQWSEEEAKENVLNIRLKGNVTNLTVDDLTVSFMDEGEITAEYDEKSDQIYTKYNGKYLAKITWEDAARHHEKINPARIAVGQINKDGFGFAEPAQNINPQLAYARDIAAGITPITDIIEHTVWLSTQCKNMYLDADKNNDAYATRLKEFGIKEKMDALAAHYDHHMGFDMSNYINRIERQLIDPTSKIYDPTAILNEHQIAHEISENYAPQLAQLGFSPSGKGTLIQRLSSVHKDRQETHIAVTKETAQFTDFLVP